MSYDGELKFTTAGDFMRTQKNIFIAGQPKFHSNPQDNLNRREIWDDTESMNDDLVSYWNETVNEGDTVFVVGELLDDEAEGLLKRLNGNIILIRNSEDALTKYVDDRLITTALSIDLVYEGYSIYMTNYLEHINTVESNLIVASDDVGLLSKVNDKYIYFKDCKGRTKFVNNLEIPIFNVNMEKWDFKPVHIDVILQLYRDYKRHYTD